MTIIKSIQGKTVTICYVMISKCSFLQVENVLKRLQQPYDDGEEEGSTAQQAAPLPCAFKHHAYDALPPAEMLDLKVS